MNVMPLQGYEGGGKARRAHKTRRKSKRRFLAVLEDEVGSLATLDATLHCNFRVFRWMICEQHFQGRLAPATDFFTTAGCSCEIYISAIDADYPSASLCHPQQFHHLVLQRNQHDANREDMAGIATEL